MSIGHMRDSEGVKSMGIGAISSSAGAAAVQRSAPSTNTSNTQSTQAAKPHHHHHAGGAKGTGALTPGTLTSSGSTPVLDTLV
jgi:hypothetical protein